MTGNEIEVANRTGSRIETRDRIKVENEHGTEINIRSVTGIGRRNSTEIGIESRIVSKSSDGALPLSPFHLLDLPPLDILFPPKRPETHR
ncbi:hypothetical protein EVAR_31598_1 [Eumeta japonica]|uniref:Uncharacterized protein n=1 Tax=Eumeta variegata TaxID=151549 RepID=A0A4C1W1V3_EUMVA|nr:hypothetical protein EVAR_31598_1 [Eumeta japonica]